ncbi:endonuclease [Ferrimonas lipolytica]|uniref:Endonuclease n=2 Tax=Ferrimonas lipolytica TaxID=2724191 RepID=A0A6H1UKN2_9GAMM|nr:endonuclease [Ferrimonas lipolytica]
MNRSQTEIIEHVFETLQNHFGCFEWWLNEAPFEVMMGAILVQNTNWNNAEKALTNLAEHCSPQGIAALPLEKLAERIRPSGYYNQKALKLKALTQWYEGYNYDIALVKQVEQSLLRQELLAIKGIGGETADAILVYATHKPSFVIDAYARRILSRNGVKVPKRYDDFQQLVEQAIPRQTELYAYYHGLIVEHGQQFCRPKPKCDGCPLLPTCLGPDVAS